jgi:hypothetical protein
MQEKSLNRYIIACEISVLRGCKSSLVVKTPGLAAAFRTMAFVRKKRRITCFYTVSSGDVPCNTDSKSAGDVTVTSASSRPDGANVHTTVRDIHDADREYIIAARDIRFHFWHDICK